MSKQSRNMDDLLQELGKTFPTPDPKREQEFLDNYPLNEETPRLVPMQQAGRRRLVYGLPAAAMAILMLAGGIGVWRSTHSRIPAVPVETTTVTVIETTVPAESVLKTEPEPSYADPTEAVPDPTAGTDAPEAEHRTEPATTGTTTMQQIPARTETMPTNGAETHPEAVTETQDAATRTTTNTIPPDHTKKDDTAQSPTEREPVVPVENTETTAVQTAETAATEKTAASTVHTHATTTAAQIQTTAADEVPSQTRVPELTTDATWIWTSTTYDPWPWEFTEYTSIETTTTTITTEETEETTDSLSS